MKKRTILTIATLLAIAVATAFFWPKAQENSNIQYEKTRVSTDTIRNSVTATGTIEPVTKVEVGTQVSGIVSKIYVDYNSEVKRGDIIAELDKTNLISELNTSKANLASVQSELDYQTCNHKRYQVLYEKGLISANEYETARLSYQKALQSQHAAIESVKKAETNLGYATITSPIDGVVLSKAVEEGQTVAASFSTPTLFTIAQDLTDMRVIADIDEADIGGVHEGQHVEFTVDAYPEDIFHGQVSQVRQEATTESNVVTYEVVISAPNESLKLKPGLTANVTITTLERPNVLSVKSKALRFTPTRELFGKSMKIEDCNGKNKLWTLDGNVLRAHQVNIGMSDGSRTEIKGGIAPDTEVILSATEIQTDTEEEIPEGGNPFMPRPGGAKKKK